MADGSWIRIGAIEAHLDAHTMNSQIKEILQRKVESITKHPELRKAIGNVYAESVKPFVPMDTGDLAESGRGTADGRVYWTATSPKGYNYAAIQYENDDFKHSDGRVSHWTDKMEESDNWNGFIEAITPLIIEEFNNDKE